MLDYLTADILTQLCEAAPEDAEKYVEPLREAMLRFDITSKESVAAFTATLGVESANLSKMREGLNYRDPERLARLFKRAFDLDHNGTLSPLEVQAAAPYCHNPAALNEKLYNGFCGRGGIQITWEKNYRHQAEKLGFPYVEQPELLEEPYHAMLTAASYWDDIHGNDIADNMVAVTRAVNGPALMHLDERQQRYEDNLALLETLA